jgi:hypothetical protein
MDFVELPLQALALKQNLPKLLLLSGPRVQSTLAMEALFALVAGGKGLISLNGLEVPTRIIPCHGHRGLHFQYQIGSLLYLLVVFLVKFDVGRLHSIRSLTRVVRAWQQVLIAV